MNTHVHRVERQPMLAGNLNNKTPVRCGSPSLAQWRRAVGIFFTPTFGNSSACSRRLEPELIEGFSLAPTCLQQLSARVVVLFHTSSPSTVRGGVPAIGVDSVDGQIFAVPRSYGPGMECIERDGPLVADLNSTAAVDSPTNRVWVRAPSLHPRPDAENPRAGHAVRRGPFLLQLLRQTPTRPRVPRTQLVPCHDAFDTTVATASPRHVRFNFPRSFKRQKAAELKACQINSSVSAHAQSVLGNDAKGGPKC